MSYDKTALWQTAFGRTDQDEHAEQRERLRMQLLLMRDKVSQLVSHIPSDCKNLTVHDVTHLDALWDSAELVCGPGWELNPAEAFVFGAAALVHDAGLTTLAYPNGREGLMSTALWADLVATRSADFDEADVLFAVLRSLHAEQAGVLCSMAWEHPSLGKIHLIEDSELRLAYSETIGRIAHSHHWPADKVQSELKGQIGGSHTLPSDWTINERKLGCLLRCADAAQIDRTRAPIMLFAALGPSGYSKLHWSAQSKLNRPTLQKDAIFLTSASAFTVDESEAWWIAYDLANVLDRELRSCNAILTDLGVSTFAAQRVAGAESPASLAKHVSTTKWRPVDASVRVTDPLKIARTLGGRNLYGGSLLVPFRELIQNATDAIRARRAIHGLGREFGSIDIIVDHHPTDKDRSLVSIDDDGIGMSERVLSTTLVDFGRSFWSSDILRDEFPGLRSKNVNHIGKFGIGFFSVFELSQDVRVTSRRYDAAHADLKTLDFRGLASRPLLREASKTDLPPGISTRVTIEVPKSVLNKLERDVDHADAVDWVYLNRRQYLGRGVKFVDAMRAMCAFLDVQVKFSDRRNGESFVHSPNVYDTPADELLTEMQSVRDSDRATKYFSGSLRLSPILAANGDAYGRAALDLDRILNSNVGNRGLVSVGGIISDSARQPLRSDRNVVVPYYGVVEGKTERAARDVSEIIAPTEAVESWLTYQLDTIDRSILRKSEIMTIAAFAVGATRVQVDIPFAFQGGAIKTPSELLSVVRSMDQVLVPVTWRYDTWPEVIGYDSLLPEFFEASLSELLVVLGKGSSRLLEEDDARNVRRGSKAGLDRAKLMDKWEQGRALIRIVEEGWGQECKCQMAMKPIFATKIASLIGERWVVCLERGNGETSEMLDGE